MISIIGAIIVISLIIYITVNIHNPKLGNNLFFLAILSSLTFDIGYFCKINNTIIEYNYIFSIIANIALVISHIMKNKINKNSFTLIIIFYIYILLNMLYPLFLNTNYISVSFEDSWDIYFFSGQELDSVSFSKHSIGMYIRVVMFIISFYIFAKNLTKEDLVEYAKKIYKLSWFIIIVSIIETFITNFVDIGLFRRVIFDLFGTTDATYFIQRMGFKGIYVPMGFMREPSTYVKSLFIFMINNLYLLYGKKLKEKKKLIINIIILLFIIIFSNSLSGYIYFIAIMCIFIFMTKNKKYKLMAFVIVPVICILVGTLAKDRIMTVLNAFNYFDLSPSKLQLQSELIRLYSMNNNLKIFGDNFLVGSGFGTIYCYSAIITLLTNIGLIGSALYLYIIYYINSIAVKNKKFSIFTFFIIFITNIFMGHMSQIIYIETFAYQLILLKSMDCIKRGDKNNE